MNATLLFYLSAYAFGLWKAFVSRPVWGVYVYFLCFYMHAPSQWWGKSLPEFRWAMVASLVTIVAIILNPPRRGFRFFEFRENWLLIALFLLVSIQTPFALVPEFHKEYVFLLFKFIMFIFIVQNTVWTAKDLERVIWVNLFGGAYLAYMGMSMHTGGRLEGIGTPGMESANQLGQQFAVLIFAGGYLLLQKFRLSHVFVSIALCFILMALFMTESRGVLAAMAVTGLLAAIFIPQGKRGKVATFGALSIVAASLLMGPQIIARFQGVKQDNLGDMKDASAQSRVVIIKSQWEMSKSSPVFGHGHRGTLILSPDYIDEKYFAHGTGHRASHNVVMAFLVDHGFVGLGIYLILIVTCAWRIWLIKRPVDLLPEKMQQEFVFLSSLKVGCTLALVCFFLSGMGSNNKKLEGDIWMFAFIPLVSARMHRIVRKQERLEEMEVKESL